MKSGAVPSVQCEFCGRQFRSIAGLRSHAVQKHAVEMDAATSADADREMHGEHSDYGYDHGAIGNK